MAEKNNESPENNESQAQLPAAAQALPPGTPVNDTERPDTTVAAEVPKTAKKATATSRYRVLHGRVGAHSKGEEVTALDLVGERVNKAGKLDSAVGSLIALGAIEPVSQ